MKLIIRLILRQIHAGLRNGQAHNANVQQSVKPRIYLIDID
jgi:hypothetical protein